jgi:hypothetical protein
LRFGKFSPEESISCKKAYPIGDGCTREHNFFSQLIVVLSQLLNIYFNIEIFVSIMTWQSILYNISFLSGEIRF